MDRKQLVIPDGLGHGHSGPGDTPVIGSKSDEDKEKDKDQDYYFNFYASLQNQANMIGDISRTGTYRKAILGNSIVAFLNQTVLDVGAGSGILSFLSAQAGASQVIALEASSMADKIQILVDHAKMNESNLHLRDRIRIVRGMVEDKAVQDQVLMTGKVDTIISEPIGVMLLHERMVESFLLARDLFLKKDGTLLPSAGHIFFCPFTDESLYNETDLKAQFFRQTLFGTDFSALYDAARAEVFSQPVVGMFPPTSLIAAPCEPKSFDFYHCSIKDLLAFTVPISFVASRTAVIHGLASWFDLDFYPNEGTRPPGRPDTLLDLQQTQAWDYPIQVAPTAWGWMAPGESPMNPGPTPAPPDMGLKVTLSTGPNAPRTHWQQARLLLPEPLAVNKHERVIGSIEFKVNDSRSYDIAVYLCVDRPGPGVQPNPLERRAEYNLAQQCFNYSYSGDMPLGHSNG